MRVAPAPLLTAAIVLVAASACSVFPAARKTPSVVEAVHVEYAFRPGSPRMIQVPASDEDLTVLELVVEPSPRGERFERGHRILLLPYDCERAELRCRVQRWASQQSEDLVAPPLELFPGARSVRFLDEP